MGKEGQTDLTAVELEDPTEDKEYQELEAAFLSGKLTDEGEAEEEQSSKESQESEEKEESSEDAPKSEGPAIQENKRLREKNRELNESLEDMARRLGELEKKTSEPKEEKKPNPLEKFSMEQLVETEVSLDQQLRTAYEDGDQQKVKELSGMKQMLRMEMSTRPQVEAERKREEREAQQQWAQLEESVQTQHPDLLKKDSETMKSAQEFLKKNPALAKLMGPYAGIVSLAQAVLLKQQSQPNPKKEDPKGDLVKELERVSKSATKRTPSTAPVKTESQVVVPDPDKDMDKFDQLWQDVRSGKIKLEGL